MAFHIRHPTSNIRHRAFTLVEATLSIAITSILLVGMGGALLLTVKAADTGDDGAGRATAAAEALSGLNAELSVATSITSFTSGDIAFTVPDRNGDGNPEAIEYTWNSSGGSMLRAYNGGTPATFLSTVKSCAPTLAQRPAAQPVESAEMILAQCDTISGSSTNNDDIKDNTYAAQYVRPVLPTGALSWKITRVRLFLQRGGSNTDQMHASICTASGALKPTLPVLVLVNFTRANLTPSPGAWVEFALGPVSGLAPTQGVCIVIDGMGGNGNVKVISLQGGSNHPFNTHYMTSGNSGASWSAPNDTEDMRFIVYGTYTTMVEP